MPYCNTSCRNAITRVVAREGFDFRYDGGPDVPATRVPTGTVDIDIHGQDLYLCFPLAEAEAFYEQLGQAIAKGKQLAAEILAPAPAKGAP